MPSCAVIIPIAPDEPHLQTTLQGLKKAGWTGEVWVAGSTQPTALPANVTWVQSTGGRATSMNTAAARTQADMLWFLHADCQIDAAALRAIEHFTTCNPDAIGYCDLRYYDGSAAMRLTELAVWLRCRVLHIPFGDQGLCMSKAQFDALGGYDENACYGEDHLLILKAKRHGIAILPVGAALPTSARKYTQNGWLATTWLHQRLWWKQLRAFRKPS